MTFKFIFSNHISTPVSRLPSNCLLDSSCSIGGHISSSASLNPPFLLSPEKLHLQSAIYTCPPLSISTTLTYAEARLLLPGPLQRHRNSSAYFNLSHILSLHSQYNSQSHLTQTVLCYCQVWNIAIAYHQVLQKWPPAYSSSLIQCHFPPGYLFLRSTAMSKDLCMILPHTLGTHGSHAY